VGTATSGQYIISAPAPTGNLSGTLIVSSHYYENTEVTGAVDISYTNSAPSSDLIPSSGVTVQITAGTNVITKTILCPANNTSWIPFEFLTPSCPGDSSIPLTISAVINPTKAISETNYADNDLSQQIWIDSAKYTEPPATFYQPTAPSTWQGVTAGSYPSTNSLTWSEWRYVNNALVLKSFYVDATASMQMTPDTRIASSTFNNGIWTMRSGYGFSNSTVLNITTNYDQPSLITTPQRIRVYFPEFDYDMQNNFTQLDTLSQTGTSTNYTFNYAFKQNPQSDILARLHFTPLWFPDGPYIVLENARDLWTPAGQINLWGSYELNISGSVFDDWNASVVPNRD
jgi:hypothetical protein